MSGGFPGRSFSLGIFTVTALLPLALHQRLTPDGTQMLSLSCPCRSGFAASRSLLAPVTLLSPPRLMAQAESRGCRWPRLSLFADASGYSDDPTCMRQCMHVTPRVCDTACMRQCMYVTVHVCDTAYM